MYKSVINFKTLSAALVAILIISSCSNCIMKPTSRLVSKSCKFPPYLKEGDKVAIISPAGASDSIMLNGAVKRLKEWKLSPCLEKYAAGTYNDYSGTAEQRLSDLQQAFDDPDVKAILCSRGGYGVVHLMEKIDFSHFKKHPKWLIGYSDITALHNLIQLHSIASIHAPMSEQMAYEPDSDKSLGYLKDILFGNLPKYHIANDINNHHGKATGILRGGNLSVYYGLRGTPYDIPPKGTILFIEDVGEHYHTIERMLYNLKLGGVLENLSGLIIGQFNKIDKKEWMNDKDTYHSIAALLAEYHYPICFGFPVGHVTENYPLVEGAKVEMNIDANGVDIYYMK